jgi:hypothetical protein
MLTRYGIKGTIWTNPNEDDDCWCRHADVADLEAELAALRALRARLEDDGLMRDVLSREFILRGGDPATGTEAVIAYRAELLKGLP